MPDSEKREFVEAFPSPAHTRVLQTQKKVTTQDSAPLTTPPTHIQTDVLRTAVFIKRFFMVSCTTIHTNIEYSGIEVFYEFLNIFQSDDTITCFEFLHSLNGYL